MRKHKNKVLAGILMGLLLAVAFWWGGDAPGLHGWEDSAKNALERNLQAETDDQTKGQADPREEALSVAASAESEQQQNRGTYAEEAAAAPIAPHARREAEGEAPVPAEPPASTASNAKASGEKQRTCTISVTCKTILEHPERLPSEKLELIPPDGIILQPVSAVFYEGENVFNVLQREMKRHKIHMEFSNTPLYNSAYIEGIHNLYQFDCGELSGWMYAVNGWFPNYGCSRYRLEDGDVIEWVYTCNLGIDVGGYYASEQIEKPSE